jgi:hypothetical protein
VRSAQLLLLVHTLLTGRSLADRALVIVPAGFIGSDTLVDSMRRVRRVLRARGLVVEVHVLDEVAPGRASTRRELAELVQRESGRVAYGTVEVPSPRRHATRVA